MRRERIEVAAHLSEKELEARYKQAAEAKDARRWHVLWLMAQGHSTTDVARVCGAHRYTVRQIVKRFNERGADGSLDRRRDNPGKPPRLTAEQQGHLLEALRGPAPDGGLWTGPKVAEWITRQTGRATAKTIGWSYLKRVGARLLTPRRRHAKAASEDEQEAWRAAFARRLERARIDAILTGSRLEVWAQDEARLGLKPIVRRVWVVDGQRPLARTHHKYEWLYVYAFVHPRTGRTFWLILPSVSTELMSTALEEFARAYGINARRRVLLMIDGAGWHVAQELRIPEGIELVLLPPYTPEMQPAERLWPLLNEAVANDAIASLDALEDRLASRCITLAGATDTISALTDYHWWPRAA
jgi:transposase